jgi:hypothetical protein
LNCPGRVADGGGVDSMLQIRLERASDRKNHCWKMKQRRRRGGTGWGEGREETMSVGLTRILLSHKMKKIQAVDSVAINGR